MAPHTQYYTKWARLINFNLDNILRIRNEIYTISENIFKNSQGVTISVYGLNGTGRTHSSWYGRVDNLESMLEKVTHKELSNRYGLVAVSECIDYVALAHDTKTLTEENTRH